MIEQYHIITRVASNDFRDKSKLYSGKCGNYRCIVASGHRECARTKGQGQGYHGNMLGKVLMMIQLGLLKQILQKPRLCNLFYAHTALSTPSLSHILKDTAHILWLMDGQVKQRQLLCWAQISCSETCCYLLLVGLQ